MSKLVSLSDVAYATLKKMKNGEESFSKVVLRLSGQTTKGAISDCYGTWHGSKEEADRIFKQIEEDRKASRMRITPL